MYLRVIFSGLVYLSLSAVTAADQFAANLADHTSLSTEAVTFSIPGNPYRTPPPNTDCCKSMALTEQEGETRQVRYRIPRNYLTCMDNWDGGEQTLVRMKFTFPGFAPLNKDTEHCLSRSPAFRPTQCVPVEINLRSAGAYEPSDDAGFNNLRNLFRSQDPIPGPYGFELYEVGPSEARINIYRKVLPEHTLVVQCYLPKAGPNNLAVCSSQSRLESNNVVSYKLYDDQLKDAEAIDVGVRKLIRKFQLE